MSHTTEQPGRHFSILNKGHLQNPSAFDIIVMSQIIHCNLVLNNPSAFGFFGLSIFIIHPSKSNTINSSDSENYSLKEFLD